MGTLKLAKHLKKFQLYGISMKTGNGMDISLIVILTLITKDLIRTIVVTILDGELFVITSYSIHYTKLYDSIGDQSLGPIYDKKQKIRNMIMQINNMIMEVKEFSFTYAGATAPSLKKINLPIQRNKITAMIGPSGCGKSTLLRSMNRIHVV